MSTPTITPPVSPPTPRRSRRRWYLLGGIAFLLAVPIAYYFIAGWWSDRQMTEMTRELDAEDPNWRWHDMVAQMKVPEDDKNASVQIAKIRDLLKDKNPLVAGGAWESAPIDPRNARLANDYLAPLKKAFAGVPKEAVIEARKLKDMPEGGVKLPAEDNPFAIKLEHIQESRAVVNLLQWDAVLRAHDGDIDGAAESCQAILNTARSVKNPPFLIGLLVRIAEQHIAVASLERALGQGPVSEANLARLQAALQAEADDDGLHQAMRGERASGHQAYVNLRTGKLTFSELMGPTNMKMGINERLLDAFPGILLHGYPDYLKLMNEQVRISKLKDVERTEAYAALEQKVRDSASTNLLIRMIMPASAKVAEATHRSQALLRCAAAGVAAERYRLSHDNKWPRGLEDLVKAGLLKEIPRDPYDGKPLRFKRTAGGVLIYSIGPDKIDNGGKLNRASPLAPNTDLGFELWDDNKRGLPPPPDAP
jgi:hypothetical protein